MIIEKACCNKRRKSENQKIKKNVGIDLCKNERGRWQKKNEKIIEDVEEN